MNDMLIVASKKRIPGVIKMLVEEKGADINCKTRNGYTPLFFSVRKEIKENVEYLLSKGANIDSGSKALFHTFDVEIIKLLILHGADIEIRNKRQETPLMRAVKMAHINTIQLLVDYGASIYATDDKGDTPLTIAYSDGIEPITDILTTSFLNF